MRASSDSRPRCCAIPAVILSQRIVGQEDLGHQTVEAATDLHMKVACSLCALGAVGAGQQRVELAAAFGIGARDAIAREAGQNGIGIARAGVRVVAGVIRMPQLDAGTVHG